MTTPDTPATVVDDEVAQAAAQLLIEVAFLVPRGTDLQTHPISEKLERYKQAIEARAIDLERHRLLAIITAWPAGKEPQR